MALNKAVLSKGCPMSFIGDLSNEFYCRVVQRMLSEGCPMSFIRGLSNGFISEVRRMGFKTKNLLF